MYQTTWIVVPPRKVLFNSSSQYSRGLSPPKPQPSVLAALATGRQGADQFALDPWAEVVFNFLWRLFFFILFYENLICFVWSIEV